MNNQSHLTQNKIEKLASFLADHWQSPEEYILNVFKTQDIVLLGEEHAIRHNLLLAQRLIPLLYQSGIYNFGMEFGASEDQAELDQLVTGAQYDENVARRLMFNYNSGWAFKEYMDIYRTVWSLNCSLPETARKFRILNLSYIYDWSDAPVVRTPENARKIYHRGPVDPFRAVLVKREILDKGEKILILTGTVHAFTRYHLPEFDFNAENFVRYEDRNLGQLLYKLAPERVFSILLHQSFDSKWSGGAQSVYPANGAIDQFMAVLAHRPIGFDLINSPLGDLPDNSYYSSGYEDFRIYQLADGYIYEHPFSAFESCTLDPLFLTEANWPEAQCQFPDPDWHRRPESLAEYWDQIRHYADVPRRYQQFA